jgi:SAM-dependent methyltransferase
MSTTYWSAMQAATRATSKYRHYGPLYDLVVGTLPATPSVLEIGVANGGSLQTWRTLLGPGARIIGADLNERALAMQDEGFEVVLADSGTDEGWAELHSRFAGAIDVLVDDGGHTNRQQILSVLNGIELVRDGGWIVLEDVHASFMREFGNPSSFSTARFLSELGSDFHRAHPRSSRAPKRPNLVDSIAYVVTATSWVGLRVQRPAAGRFDEVTIGSNRSLMDYDHRWDSSRALRRLSRLPGPAARAARQVVRRPVALLDSLAVFKRDARRP